MRGKLARRLFGAVPVLSAIVVASALFAASLGLERDPDPVVDVRLYSELAARTVRDVTGLVADFELQQFQWLPLLPPDPDVRLVQNSGIVPFHPAGFPDVFVKGLVPVTEDGILTYPVTVYEDPLTRERILVNARGERIASRPSPSDYNPRWYIEEQYPALDEMDRDRADWLIRVYDPSRIAIRYQLIADDMLIEYVWKRSIEAALQAEPDGGIMRSGWEGGTVSNLAFVAIERDTNGYVDVTIAWPTAGLATNGMDIFVCTNLLETDWEVVCATNVDLATNCFFWRDTGRADAPLAFYDCWTSEDGDGDGLSDGREARLFGTDAEDDDSDDDGLTDGSEVLIHGTDPLDADQDDDLIRDGWEIRNFGGLSRAPAFVVTNGVATIQAGLNAVSSGDVVLVLSGVYTGSANRDLDFGGKDVFLLSELGSHSVTIDCQGAGRAFRFGSGEGPAAVVSGFTIANGAADYGAGIYCVTSSPTIRDCRIAGGAASIDGGGIYLWGASPVISNCVIEANTAATNGGGICAVANLVWSYPPAKHVSIGSSPHIVDCRISGNAAQDGAGLWTAGTEPGTGYLAPEDHDYDAPRLAKCVFSGNEAPDNACVAVGVAVTATVENCVIMRSKGSGVKNVRGCLSLMNCALTDNHYTATPYAAGVNAVHSGYYAGYTRIRNTIIWHNVPGYDQVYAVGDTGACTVAYSAVDTNAWCYPNGNKTALDPTNNVFAVPHITRDGHLETNSPCIDTGTATDAPDDDLDGEARSGGVDIGCDELLDTDGDGMADWWEMRYGYNPNVADSPTANPDGDELTDYQEYVAGTDPTTAAGDADRDGLTGDAEVYCRTDADDWDTDGDLFSDGWEVAYGFDPLSGSAPVSTNDHDEDGLTNFEEMRYGTDPTAPDTDGDGVSDGLEVANGSDPADAADGGDATNCVAVDLVVGDWSGSESERYELRVGTGTVHHVSPDFGAVASNRYYFVAGKSYPFEVRWIDTDPTQDPLCYDYDYEARIGGLPAGDSGNEWMSGPGFVVHDPHGILGKANDCGNNGTPNAFNMTGKTGALHIIRVEFIDEVPNYSLDSTTDCDNYFLRQNEDYTDLDIYYRILPEGLPVTNVVLKVYEEDTSTVVTNLQGEMDGSDFKTGDDLHVQWADARDDDEDFRTIGFYPVELEVYVDGLADPIATPIDDGDTNMPCWQCPQEGLAIHDLVWKHRPALYVGSEEHVAPNGPCYPFDASFSTNRYRLQKDNTWPIPDGPAWTPPPTNYAGWGFPSPADDVVPEDYTYTVLQACVDNASGDLEDLFIDMLGQDEGGSDKPIIQDSSIDAYLCHHGLTSNNHVFVQFFEYETASYAPYGVAGGFIHDGDWEMVQFCVQLQDTNNPTSKPKWLMPWAATASQHYYGQTLAWRWDKEGTTTGTATGLDQENHRYVLHADGDKNRFQVYVAENAHATYFLEGDVDFADVGGETGTQVQYDTTPNAGYDSTTNAFEIETYYLLPLVQKDQAGIYDWPGRWGEHHDVPGYDAPKGPFYREVQSGPGADFRIALDPVRLHNECRKLVDLSGDFDAGGDPDPETALNAP